MQNRSALPHLMAYVLTNRYDLQHDVTINLILQVNYVMQGSFNWDIKQETFFLGSYMYGYAPMNAFGAVLARRYGVKTVYGFAILFSSLSVKVNNADHLPHSQLGRAKINIYAAPYNLIFTVSAHIHSSTRV